MEEIFCIGEIFVDRGADLGHCDPTMARESVIIECTEARKEGKPPSRYMASRNKKLQTEPVEKKKYNRFLRRHTLHKEIKN